MTSSRWRSTIFNSCRLEGPVHEQMHQNDYVAHEITLERFQKHFGAYTVAFKLRVWAVGGVKVGKVGKS
jgi:hypothetical protein